MKRMGLTILPHLRTTHSGSDVHYLKHGRIADFVVNECVLRELSRRLRRSQFHVLLTMLTHDPNATAWPRAGPWSSATRLPECRWASSISLS